MKFSDKFTITILCLQDGQSKVKAISAISNVSGMSLSESRYILAHAPQLLCVNGCETFKSIVMDTVEANTASEVLKPYLEISIQNASEQVLPYGMMSGLPPWDTDPNWEPPTG
jgi:hypothetical protein